MSTLLERLKAECILHTDYFSLKSFAIQSKHIYLTYPRHVDNIKNLVEYLQEKLSDFDHSIEIINYSGVNETSKLLHRHCHLFIELENPPSKKIRASNLFDLTDGTHPNIIGSVNRSGNIHHKIYNYHRKTGDFAIDSFSKEDKSMWNDGITIHSSKKVNVRSTPASEIRDFPATYRQDPDKFEKVMSQPEIESILSSSSRLAHLIKPPPSDIILQSYESMALDHVNTSSLSILHVINRKDDGSFSSFRDYLYNHYEGICQVQYKSFGMLPKFIHGYNTSTADLQVKTIVTQVPKPTIAPKDTFFSQVNDFMNNDVYIISKSKAKKVNQSPKPNLLILNGIEFIRNIYLLPHEYRVKSSFLFVNETYEYEVLPEFDLNDTEKEQDIRRLSKRPSNSSQMDLDEWKKEDSKIKYQRMLLRKLKPIKHNFEVPLKIFNSDEIIQLINNDIDQSLLKKYFSSLVKLT